VLSEMKLLCLLSLLFSVREEEHSSVRLLTDCCSLLLNVFDICFYFYLRMQARRLAKGMMLHFQCGTWSGSCPPYK
jgi:hypothetical protein